MDMTRSSQSKLSRRTRKYSRMVLKETGIGAITSSKNLMICNAGLVSGFDRERVVSIFSHYAPIAHVVMIPQKSYCFVQFPDENKAQITYNAIHGKLIVPEANGPLYLIFTENIPDNDTSFNFVSNVNGLVVVKDFLDDNEELLLISFMQKQFEKSIPSNNLKHRSVKHYGYEFDYKTNGINLQVDCDEIPKELTFLINRLQMQNACKNWIPEQITVNRYMPGQGIPPHVDTHSVFDDFIVSVSVGSDIVMEFKNNWKRCYVMLPRKSVLIITDEARYGWTHGITPRNYDVMKNELGDLTVHKRQERISFTFRRLRSDRQCNCQFKDYCDTQNRTEVSEFNIDDNIAFELEKVHVHQVYNEIASHFSETRHKPWPNVEHFVKSFELASVYFDIGCGNGKYFGLNSSIFEVGCDRSYKLSEECHKRNFESLVCDCLELPYRSGSADYCTCIAVIHHLSTRNRRLKAIREIARVLRLNGKALIYVWAKNQRQNEESSSYIKQRGRNKQKVHLENANEESSFKLASSNDKVNISSHEQISLPVHVNRTQFKHEDMLVPWKLSGKHKCTDSDTEGKTFFRYYHVFNENELEELCGIVQGIKIIKRYYDQGNWCVIIQKLS